MRWWTRRFFPTAAGSRTSSSTWATATRPSCSRATRALLSRSSAGFCEVVVHDQQVAHGAGEPQLHRPFSGHLEVEPRCVFSRLLPGPGFHRLDAVRHRHGRHVGADAELRARQRLAAAAQTDDAVVDEVFSSVFAIQIGIYTLGRGRRGEKNADE